MNDEQQRRCLANLAPEVCRWLQDIDGYASMLFIEEFKELSPSKLAQLLGHVDARKKVVPGKRRGIKEKLESLKDAQILVVRPNLDDKREELYSLGEGARLVIEQSRARSRGLDQEIHDQEKAVIKAQQELNRAKAIQRRLRSPHGLAHPS